MSDQDDRPGPTPPPGDQPPPTWGSAYPPPAPGPAPYYVPPAKHPQAVTALILGILGLVVCGVIAPFAWVIGNRAVNEIDANPAAYSGRSEASAGKILGIVGTSILALMLLVAIPLILIALAVG
ncbi:DUF4190 domain-containing protein [Aeromicrobium sp.]|uniref:DUF4190 domain-containing protein n=1 Tax=Aeromicrobium sp. TaxID=1871063 RepID=UPI003C385A4F